MMHSDINRKDLSLGLKSILLTDYSMVGAMAKSTELGLYHGSGEGMVKIPR